VTKPASTVPANAPSFIRSGFCLFWDTQVLALRVVVSHVETPFLTVRLLPVLGYAVLALRDLGSAA
jgi:hypothetical protein